jgi:hypothetical protein
MPSWCDHGLVFDRLPDKDNDNNHQNQLVDDHVCYRLVLWVSH